MRWKRKDRVITVEEQEEIRTKDFFDLITPSALRFFTGYYILGDTYRRGEDKTNSNILILGNSGQGKSYLLKLLLINTREAGKQIICLDPEAEYQELCENLGGTYLDFLSGRYIINPLEPKMWAEPDDSDEKAEKEDASKKEIYTEETLQRVCLGIHSMCVGAESRFFNGHTNIKADDFLCFGVKGLMDTNKKLKDAMLFNILSYMSNLLLSRGNTLAAIDELYLFLSSMTAIEYIRNGMKRDRKKDSSIAIASQNVEDFLIPAVKEYTKPLFSIPTHQFLFHAGQINAKEYMDALQVEPSEYELIKYPERGTALYRCGSERYLLQVIAPDYKEALFGKAGGR